MQSQYLLFFVNSIYSIFKLLNGCAVSPCISSVDLEFIE